MKIGIVTNVYKDEKFIVSRCVVKFLNDNNIEPIIDVDIKDDTLKYNTFESLSRLKTCNYAIVIGGDGTLLNISAKCAKYDVPILAINLGTLGYLANVEREEIIEALTRLIDNNFIVDKRMMIETRTSDGKYSRALNDFVVTKGMYSRVVCLEVSINGNALGLIRGDGLIISTPTGSTAYNLSAGGPILESNSNTIVITPICPQTPSFPIVISADEEIQIKVTYRSASDVALVCDGEIVNYVKNNEEIIINKSDRCIKLVKVFNKSNFEVFNKKYFHEFR